jgi:hypothetical protein
LMMTVEENHLNQYPTAIQTGLDFLCRRYGQTK